MIRWREMLTETYRVEVETLRDAVLTRLLPTFDHIEDEAKAHADAEYARLGAMPGGDGGGWDMGDAAEWAQDAGIGYYERLTGVRQTLLNMATAAVYHLYEQQAVTFLTREVITWQEERTPTVLSKLLKPAKALPELTTRLRALGVDVGTLRAANMLEELRLVANTIKHGSGDSAENLHKKNPYLFVAPELRPGQPLGAAFRPGFLTRPRLGPRRVDRPLAGRDLYVTAEEYAAYADTVVAYWAELAGRLSA